MIDERCESIVVNDNQNKTNLSSEPEKTQYARVIHLYISFSTTQKYLQFCRYAT